LEEGLWRMRISSQGVCKVTYVSDLGRPLRLGGERRGEEHRTRASEERAPVHDY